MNEFFMACFALAFVLALPFLVLIPLRRAAKRDREAREHRETMAHLLRQFPPPSEVSRMPDGVYRVIMRHPVTSSGACEMPGRALSATSSILGEMGHFSSNGGHTSSGSSGDADLIKRQRQPLAGASPVNAPISVPFIFF